nr:hypothetical protein [Acetatifactor sp.]
SKLIFNISNLLIYGLENVKLMPLTDVVIDNENDSFNLGVSVCGPEYCVQKYPVDPFLMTLDFYVQKDVCAYLKEEVAKGKYVPADFELGKDFPYKWPENSMIIRGSMMITLNLENVTEYPIQLNSKIIYRIESADGNRFPEAVVSSLDISKEFVKKSDFCVQTLDSEYEAYNEKLKQYVQLQFRNHFVVDALLQSIVEMMNQENILGGMSEHLTMYTAKTFDDILGPVEGVLPTTVGQESNAVDQYILDRIRYAICSPASKFYIQDVIRKCKTPDLDHLLLGDIDLGNVQDIGGLNLENLKLFHVLMTGLSNVKLDINDIGFIAAPDESEDYVTFKAKLNLTIAGGLQFSAEGENIEGAFTVTTTDNPFAVKCVVSGNTVDDLSVTIETAELQFDQNALKVSLDIQSYLINMVVYIFNLEPVKKKLVEAFNQKLALEKQEVSKLVTDKIKQVFYKQLTD